jgi:hypothetical protein
MLEPFDVRETLDDSLESWCLLVLRPEDEVGAPITAWHAGIGNSRNLLRTNGHSDAPEPELLETLVEDVLEPQRTDDVTTTVITPYRTTLPRLRERFLATNTGVTLRGLKHLSMEGLVTRYFLSSQTRNSRTAGAWAWLPVSPDADGGEPVVRALWKSINEVGPLVPREELTGEPL